MQEPTSNRGLKKDVFIVSISVLVALALVRSGFVEEALSASRGVIFLGAFIAGGLFTSILTTPLALASFAELVKVSDVLPLTLFASIGAVLADILLFIFIKARTNKLSTLALGRLHHSRLGRLFKYRSFRLILPFLGIFAIASPLPDEVGLAILGLSHMRLSRVAALSFGLHFIGIFLVLLAMSTLV